MKKEFWNERYSDEDYIYGTDPNAFLVSAAKYIKPHSKILSLGEGEGRNATFLALQGHDVTALDQSEIGLAKAVALAQKHECTLTTIATDIDGYDLGQKTYDCIVSIFCHLPSPIRRPLHQKIKHALRKDGVYIMEAYAPEQIHRETGGPKIPDMLVSIEEARAAFSECELICHQSLTREVNEGAFHHGMANVIQLIARKQ